MLRAKRRIFIAFSFKIKFFSKPSFNLFWEQKGLDYHRQRSVIGQFLLNLLWLLPLRAQPGAFVKKLKIKQIKIYFSAALPLVVFHSNRCVCAVWKRQHESGSWVSCK